MMKVVDSAEENLNSVLHTMNQYACRAGSEQIKNKVEESVMVLLCETFEGTVVNVM